MTGDVGDRLTRLETQREHDHESAKRWSGQLQGQIENLSKEARQTSERLTKIEGKMGIVWAALAAFAMLIGGALFNFLSKGGTL